MQAMSVAVERLLKGKALTDEVVEDVAAAAQSCLTIFNELKLEPTEKNIVRDVNLFHDMFDAINNLTRFTLQKVKTNVSSLMSRRL